MPLLVLVPSWWILHSRKKTRHPNCLFASYSDFYAIIDEELLSLGIVNIKFLAKKIRYEIILGYTVSC